MFINREAGEIIRLVASVLLSVRPFSYTLKKSHRVYISRSIQNGWAFKMVVVLTGCAITVDHAFNLTDWFIRRQTDGTRCIISPIWVYIDVFNIDNKRCWSSIGRSLTSEPPGYKRPPYTTRWHLLAVAQPPTLKIFDIPAKLPPRWLMVQPQIFLGLLEVGNSTE